MDGDNTQDEPIGNYREHQFTTLDGQFSNFASCVGAGQCLLDEKQLQAYDAWPFTIVQLRASYVTKEGKPVPVGRKLLISKKEAMQKFLRYVAQKQGLTGTIWSVFRTSKSAYTIGDDWQFITKIGGDAPMPAAQRRAEMAKPITLNLPDPQDPKKVTPLTFNVPPECLQPINYRELLKPKTKDELMAAGIDWAASKKWQEDGKERFQKKGGAPSAPRGSSAAVPY